MNTADQIVYRPIGIINSPYVRRIDAPHQSTVVEGTESGEPALATLTLAAWVDEQAVQDLDGFERIWLIFAFHLSEGWKSAVQAEVARALGRWEPRLQLDRVKVVAVLDGQVSLALKGRYLGDEALLEMRV